MHEPAVERVAPAYGSSTRDEEARSPYLWLDSHVERIERRVTREECLDFYEYHAVLATLMA
jgi:hypothetical protein